ncbi:MAG: hypothetical protein V1740_02155 [Candidatus Woesearchaeota archaeon]
MNDVIVSIRIPESLLNKLKEQAEKDSYMDISEEIRSIVRNKWLFFQQPELMEIKKLRKDISDQLKEKREKSIMREVVKELNKIREEIKKDGALK